MKYSDKLKSRLLLKNKGGSCVGPSASIKQILYENTFEKDSKMVTEKQWRPIPTEVVVSEYEVLEEDHSGQTSSFNHGLMNASDTLQSINLKIPCISNKIELREEEVKIEKEEKSQKIE